jgi:hypothetical protein
MYAKRESDLNLRTADEIVEQLADVLRIKRDAIKRSRGEFADSMVFTTLERQERALYAELRSALVPRRRASRRRKAG